MNNYAGLMDGDATMRAAQETLRQIQRTREALDVTPAGKGASMLVQVSTAGSFPATAQAVYVVVPAEADAEDDEGASATYTPDNDSAFYCINLGSSIPPQGTTIIAHAVGGRWTMRYDG